MQAETFITGKTIQLKLIPESSLEQATLNEIQRLIGQGSTPIINGKAGEYLTVTLDTPANARAQKISS